MFFINTKMNIIHKFTFYTKQTTFNSLVFYIKIHSIIPIIKKKPKIAPPIARTPNIIGPKIVKNKRIKEYK